MKEGGRQWAQDFFHFTRSVSDLTLTLSLLCIRSPSAALILPLLSTSVDSYPPDCVGPSVPANTWFRKADTGRSTADLRHLLLSYLTLTVWKVGDLEKMFVTVCRLYCTSGSSTYLHDACRAGTLAPVDTQFMLSKICASTGLQLPTTLLKAHSDQICRLHPKFSTVNAANGLDVLVEYQTDPQYLCPCQG